ncbi:MAG: hypothetical protein IJ011_01795 [Clostridia bacterium]|nr:hypothetical protein [Clostridia bacterium]
MKKALSLILSLVIVIGLVPMAALPAFAENVEYTVINSITEITGAGNYKLADTYAGEAEGTTITTPIAITDDTVIDGNGKTVTNLTVNTSGLFTLAVGKTLTVKNITFGTESAPVTQTGNGDSGLFVGTVGNDKVAVTTTIFENVDVYVNSTHTGTIAGMVGSTKENGRFIANNCSVNGTISTTSSFAGGYIAYAQCSVVDIQNSVNNASVTSATAGGAAGGFIGFNHNGASTTDDYADYVRIEKCSNNGDIKTSNAGNSSAGGIIGFSSTRLWNIDIIDCVNKGNVSDAIRAGGIVGIYNPSANTAFTKTISGCVNYGAVNTNGFGGGILGVAEGNANNLTIEDCVNYGAIKEGNKSNRGGGILGYDNVTANNAITIDGCINYGNIGGRSAGGVVGLGNVTNSLSVIKSCASLGDVKGDVGSGGITGKLNGGTVINCIVGDISISTHTSTAVSAYVANEVISGATVKNVLNLSNVTVATSGATVTTDALYSIGDKTLAELLTIVNSDTGYTDGDVTYKFTDIAGRWASNSDGDNLVLATPEFEGYQLSAVDTATNKYNVRLIATINDVKLANPCEYKFLGIEVSKDGGENYTPGYVEYVYTSVMATGSGEQITYTAEELGGKYIYALRINNISATEDVELTIRTFATDKDDNTYYGDTYTISLPATVAASN